MRRFESGQRLIAISLLGIVLSFGVALATDVDGPDCNRNILDWGDAPEGLLAYPVSAPGVMGCFPTCFGFGLASTQTFVCPPISTPPGISGYITHIQAVNTPSYWLGCYASATGAPMGIDSEPDGKVNSPPVGSSFCHSGLLTDCVSPFEGGFDQDECYGDGSDATLKTKLSFLTCTFTSFPFEVYSCATFQRNIFLNVAVDWNQDGDWNDNFICTPGTPCAYEWAVKNATLTIGPGCNFLATPAFQTGPFVKNNVWLRITISDTPVNDDYPWAGSSTMGPVPGGDQLRGGETEDYQVDVKIQTPTEPTTWGHIKALYR